MVSCRLTLGTFGIGAAGYVGRGPDIKVVLYAGLSHARMPVPACVLGVVNVPVLADMSGLTPFFNQIAFNMRPCPRCMNR